MRHHGHGIRVSQAYWRRAPRALGRPAPLTRLLLLAATRFFRRSAGRGLALALCSAALGAQVPGPVRGIEFRTVPADARVRPFEVLVVQVMAAGEGARLTGGAAPVPLKRGPAAFYVHGVDGGWVSKPFSHRASGEIRPRHDGPDGAERRLLTMSDRQSDLSDAVLYTAPGREGESLLTATLEGVSATLRIRVDAAAEPTVAGERVTFGAQPAAPDPYRPLAERYAPFVAQETWFQPKADYLARFDADGDWRGDNNWDNTPESSSQAFVYYAAMETETHWFLIYNFFHPRDYSDKCIAGTCHENDNEGMILTIAKDGTPWGRPVAMETLAHNKVYSYRADPRVRGNFHNLDGEVEFVGGTHPVVFVHSGGHGVYGSGQHSGYSLSADHFEAGTGVTYVYKGVAERPRHPADRNVGYDLLPIYDHWWIRSQQERDAGGAAFSGYYRYQPQGGRPQASFPFVAGAFLSRKHAADMAKPFWGWHDNDTLKQKLLAKGQWGLDPAYAITRNLTLPGPVSLRYVFNPYLSAPDAVSEAE